jgi:hypothetical protein
MVNMSVPYSRPNRSLLTLRDEVYAAYNYTPARASEFVTGYKSPDNFTGHNADSNGIVHAMDIFTDNNGNLPEDEGRELAEKLRMIGKATNRFYYLIHDMNPNPGQTTPLIAGTHTNWEWVDYAGSSPHTDHIHISTCDLYWGDPAPVSAALYDSTAAWGIASTINPSGTTKPQEADLSAAEVKQITDYIGALMIYGYTSGGVKQPGIAAVVAENQKRIDAIPGKVWGAGVKRGDQTVSALQELADAKTVSIALQAQVAALTELVKHLGAASGVDPSALEVIVEKAVKNALSTTEIEFHEKVS